MYCIKECLNNYDLTIHALKKKLSDRYKHVTLLTLWRHLDDLHVILDPIDKIVGVSIVDGSIQTMIESHQGDILSFLFDLDHKSSNSTLFGIFRSVFSTFASTISNWVNLGMLTDSMFVKRINDLEFELTHYPRIFTKTLSEKILNTGKSVVLLRNLGGKVISPIDIALGNEKNLKANVSQSIEVAIIKHAKAVDMLLLNAVDTNVGIVQTLERFNDFYFCRSHPVQVILDHESDNSLDFIMEFCRDAKIDVNSCTKFENLTFSLKRPFPIDLLISNKSMEIYQKIQSFLMRISALDSHNQRLWTQNTRERRGMDFWSLHQILNHWVCTIDVYVQTHIDTVVRALMKAVRKAESVTDVSAIQFHCLSEMMNVISERMLNLCHQIHDIHDLLRRNEMDKAFNLKQQIELTFETIMTPSWKPLDQLHEK